MACELTMETKHVTHVLPVLACYADAGPPTPTLTWRWTPGMSSCWGVCCCWCPALSAHSACQAAAARPAENCPQPVKHSLLSLPFSGLDGAVMTFC